VNPALLRATDLAYSGAHVTKAREQLHWSAQTRFPQLVEKLVDAELART